MWVAFRSVRLGFGFVLVGARVGSRLGSGDVRARLKIVCSLLRFGQLLLPKIKNVRVYEEGARMHT